MDQSDWSAIIAAERPAGHAGDKAYKDWDTHWFEIQGRHYQKSENFIDTKSIFYNFDKTICSQQTRLSIIKYRLSSFKLIEVY